MRFARRSSRSSAFFRLATPAPGSPKVSPESDRVCVAFSRWSQRQKTGSRGRWATREAASQSWLRETTSLCVCPRRSHRKLPRAGSLGHRTGLQHWRHLATFRGESRDSARRPHCLCAPHSSPPTSPPPAHPAGRAGSSWGWGVGNSVNGKGRTKPGSRRSPLLAPSPVGGT